jgi:hypothetical protein
MVGADDNWTARRSLTVSTEVDYRNTLKRAVRVAFISGVLDLPGTAMTSSLYAQGRRALVIHEDDVGMTHGSNVAFRELSERG